ncbi:2-methylcitrate dehydratase PrpD [Delftia lacustris]|nr:2-methylcitrate dehydratase PrpD [Delftia lacustris]
MCLMGIRPGAAISDGPDWPRAGATLETAVHITRFTFKSHVGSGHSFAAFDAALALRSQHGQHAEVIRIVEVATYVTALDVA